MRAFDYAIAENEAGTLEALRRGYKVKAAGIDLLDILKEGMGRDDRFVSILPVGSLRGIEERGEGIIVRTLATLEEISRNEAVRVKLPALSDAAKDAASPQIRECATAGGNLLQRPRCWYLRAKEYNCLKKGGGQCFAVDGENRYHAIFGRGPCYIVHPSNLAPVIVATSAQLKVRGPDSERTISADEFFVSPDRSMYAETVLEANELLTEIEIPKLPERSAYVSFKEKQGFDWPIASCAVAFGDGKWRVVLGHVAPIPWRAAAAEEALGDAADVDDELAARAAAAAVGDANPMSQNAWRVSLARASVRRALLKACGREPLA